MYNLYRGKNEKTYLAIREILERHSVTYATYNTDSEETVLTAEHAGGTVALSEPRLIEEHIRNGKKQLLCD